MACWVFDMKKGAFFPIRKPRKLGNKFVTYKQIYRLHVDGIAQ